MDAVCFNFFFHFRNTVNKVAEVVNEMGEASAHAQGLNKPITTAERLRQSDQNLYLLIDHDANK